MLDDTHIEQTFKKIYKLSPARFTEATIYYEDSYLTRFANNKIIQNVASEDVKISVRILADNRMGRATTNRADDESLSKCCEAANQLAKNAAPDKDALPFLGKQTYQTVNPFFESTHFTSPHQNVEYVQQMLDAGNNEGLALAGINKIASKVYAIGNSQGLAAIDRRTHATASVTAMIQDGSGFAIYDENDVTRLDYEAIASEAIDTARRARNPRELPPGAYTVILTPQAVANLLSFLVVDYISQVSFFSGTAYYQKQGFVAGKLNHKIFGDNFTLKDDAYHPLQKGLPFDGEGIPRTQVNLVTNGIVTQLVHSRASALQLGAEATGHGLELPNPYGAVPQNLVLEGGSQRIDEIIAATENGVLVSRFWYNRLVDPNDLMVTGMTRDGTFLVQDGKIVSAIKNLRFNQSLLESFNKITALGPAVRTYDEETGQIMVVPPLRIADFHFTNVTLF